MRYTNRRLPLPTDYTKEQSLQSCVIQNTYCHKGLGDNIQGPTFGNAVTTLKCYAFTYYLDLDHF